ncbi:hypothetical protein N9D22_05190 [Flavobacteriaceae bacterium]|nr:hypothetical protein [Flavobacteriaceae bacterium]
MGPKGIGPNRLGAPKAAAKQTGKALIGEKLKRTGKEIIESEPRPTYSKQLKRLPRQPIEVPASAGVVNTGNTMPTSNADISSIKTKNNTSVDKKELRKVKKGLIKEQRQKFKEAKKEIKSYTDY